MADSSSHHELITLLMHRAHCDERALDMAIKKMRGYAEISKTFKPDPTQIFNDITEILNIAMGRANGN